jgi:hypothetical protein
VTTCEIGWRTPSPRPCSFATGSAPPHWWGDTRDAVVDRRLRDVVLPAIEQSLFDNPFSAYWFFVQTGGLPRTGQPYAVAPHPH